MHNREQLRFMLETGQRIIRKTIDDITDHDSMVCGADRSNHARWQVGHLAYFDGYTLALAGDRSEDYRSLKEPFGMGSTVSDDPAAYPPWTDLRESLYRIHAKLNMLVSDDSGVDPDMNVSEGEGRQPLWQVLTFVSLHESYHAGQIVAIRRALGLDRAFG